MPTSGPVFLSYTGIDRDFALRFAAALKNAGVPVWMDRLELQPGCDWRRELENVLAGAGGMICVLSPDYVSSQYCLVELASIDRYNAKHPAAPKPLFPAVVRPLPDDKQPLEVRRLQYVHFYDKDRDWRDDNLFDERLRQLLAALKATSDGGLVGDPPGREVQYLNGFVAELETRRGVMEFVELAAEARGVGRQPPPDDEFGYTVLLGPPQSSSAQPPVPLAAIAEATARFDKFVLLGEPGAGKTTALRRLARATARERLASDRFVGHPLPLLLYLPQWTNEPTPAAFVRARWQAYGLPPADPVELARVGEVALYLDGLNEMGADGPRKAGLLAGWLKSADGPKRVVVTCRARDYHGPLALGDLPTVTVRELDEPQVRQFAANYLGDRAAAFLSRVLPPPEAYRRPDPRRMHTLATNPYLLGALVFLFEQSPEGELPANNGLLFRRLAQALWTREKQRNTPGWRPFEEVEGRFAALAFAMIDEGQPIDVPEGYAAEKLGDSTLLQLGLSASFLQGTDGTVRFYHQLFQEYFAGVALLGREDLERFVVPYEFETKEAQPTLGPSVGVWNEPLTAAAGIAADRLAFAARVGRTDPLLAISGLGSLDEPTPVLEVLVSALWDRLDARAARMHGYMRPIAKVPDGYAQDHLQRARHYIWDFCSEVGGRLGRVGRSAIEPLVSALDRPTAEVRATALIGLSHTGFAGHMPRVAQALDDWGEVPDVPYFHGDGGQEQVSAYAARCLATASVTAHWSVLRRWVNAVVRRGASGGHSIYHPLAVVGPRLLPVMIDVFATGDDDTRIALANAMTGAAFGKVRIEPTTPEPRVVELIGLYREMSEAIHRREWTRHEWLCGLTTHAEVVIRYQACYGLAELVKWFREWKKEMPHETRQGVLSALQVALTDRAVQVRLKAVWGLEHFGDKAPLDHLRRLADTDPDERVRTAAADAVKRLTLTMS